MALFSAVPDAAGAFFAVARVPPAVNRTALLPGYAARRPHFLAVAREHAGDFADDLTARDDVLLAFLALLLLLAIQAVVSALLLRTARAGAVSNFRFSVAQALGFVRELQPHRVVRPVASRPAPARHDAPDDYHDTPPVPPAPPARPRLNLAVLALALAITALTFALDVAVLFLTSPVDREVSNSRRTLRMFQPVLPEWPDVSFHNRASFNRPCVDVTLEKVDPGSTRSNVCVATNVPSDSFDLFEKATQPITLNLTSDLHEYGAQHRITFGDQPTAVLSARVYFQLGDAVSRTMIREQKHKDEEEGIRVVHQQFVAFLFNAYKLSVPDDDAMNLDRLNALDFDFTTTTGSIATVNTVGQKIVFFDPPRYTTTVTGVIPRGPAAARLGQHFFRAALAIGTSGPNVTDLLTETGIRDKKAVVWTESVRLINWLSLTILLLASFALQTFLRYRFRPVTTVDIAGAWVKRAVGANLYRSPLHVDRSERRTFQIRLDHESSAEDGNPHSVPIFQSLRKAD